MSNVCKKANFDPKVNSAEISINLKESLDKLAARIIEVLEGETITFSISLDASKDPNTYMDSLEALRKTIINKLYPTINRFKATLAANEVIEHFKPKVKILYRLNESIVVIPEADLYSEDYRRNLEFDDIVTEFFGKNAAAKLYREKVFGLSVLLASILDLSENTKQKDIDNGNALVTNAVDLNNRLLNYKNDLYKLIYKYLQEIGLKSEGTLPKTLYAAGKVLPGHVNTLNAMYNIIEQYKAKGILDDLIILGWEAEVFDTKNSKARSFLQALNAYINLTYFDKALWNTLGDYISINSDLTEPIITNADGTKTYKYGYTRENNLVRNNMGDTARDAIAEVGKFSKILIESMPLYSYYDKGIKLNNNVTVVGFTSAFINLQEAVLKLSGYDDFSQNILSFHYTGSLSLLTALSLLFSTVGTQTLLIKALKLNGLNDYDLNVLYSVYKTLWDNGNKGNRSYAYAELLAIKMKGLTNNYGIINAILNVADSSVAMNYLQTAWNSEDSKYETTVKLKYLAYRSMYEIVENANYLTINRSDKEDLLQQYKLTNPGGSLLKYVLELNKGGNSFTFNIDITAKENSPGILTKSVDQAFFSCKSLKKFNSEIDLNTIASRNRLINGDGLTQVEQEFMALLDFIDTMLGTTFSRSSDGLYEFHIFKQLESNALRNLMASATTALTVMNIQLLFESDIATGKTNLASSQIVDYYEDHRHPLFAPSLKTLTANRALENLLIDKTFNGTHLSVMHKSLAWLRKLCEALAIISGEISKATIKDFEGNGLPNYSPAFEGANIGRRLLRLRLSLLSASHLLFVANPRAINAAVVDTEVKLQDGTTKSVKTMTLGELLHHAIVDKFFVPLSDEHIYVLPTTYSDKTKFINYDINLTALPLEFTKLWGEKFELFALELYLTTIGAAYKLVYLQVLLDYGKIFGLGDTEPLKEELLSLELELRDIKQEKSETSSPQIKLQLQESENKIRELAALINAQIKSIELNIINNLGFINDLLKTMDEQTFIQKAEAVHLTAYRDTHYRVVGKTLQLNELLFEYANNLYTPEGLKARFADEKVKFVEALIQNNVIFKVNRDNKEGGLDSAEGNPVTQALLKYANYKDWVLGERMIIAKIKKPGGSLQNILYGNSLKLNTGESLILNPLLERYFYLLSLFGNNLRYSLTGSEINHKVKPLKGYIESMNKAITLKALAYKQAGNEEDYNLLAKGNFTFFEVQLLLNNPNLSVLAKADLLGIYKEFIYKTESSAQSALLKRNVIIPATMHFYALNTIKGIASTMEVAVFDDIKAYVFNPDGSSTDYNKGKGSSIDAHDGSVFVNGITSIWENWSLEDAEVGTVKKPIWHHYDSKYMTATLFKDAVDTMTNLWMRLADGSRLNLRKLFKRMTNRRWSENRLRVDLMYGCAFKDDCAINFRKDILANLPTGDLLFYRFGSKNYSIRDFGRTNGIYYTLELEVKSNGRSNGTDLQIVYLLFDNLGNQHKVRVVKGLDGLVTIISNGGIENLLFDKDGDLMQIPLGYHTIDSAYELHEAMGSIYSLSLIEVAGGQTKFIGSEASNYIVAMYGNLVTNKIGNGQAIDLTNYFQPIKHCIIDYAANNSAIKNGAGNVNTSASYYDETAKLHTMHVSTEGYGVLMDADHTADEAQMTEFSLVISSLDSGGRMHEYVALIYDVLGLVALEEADIEIDAIQELRNSNSKHKLYDVLARTIINNFSERKGAAGLGLAILKGIKKELNLHNDHDLDNVFLPFSDPNIYSSILSTFVSVLNKKSVKREYPGTGAVMVPGYDIVLLWDLDGNTLLYTDVLKASRKWLSEVKKTLTEDPTLLAKIKELTDLEAKLLNLGSIDLYQNFLISAYLQVKLDEIPTFNSLNTPLSTILEDYLPLDTVNVSYYDITGNQHTDVITLEQILDYYSFKLDTTNFLTTRLQAKNGGIGVIDLTKGINFLKNIRTPRNLAPMKVNFTYTDANKVKHKVNLYDCPAILLIYTKGIRDSQAILLTLNDLHNGIYYDAAGVKQAIDPGSFVSSAAELVMSNLFKSKFNIQDGDSILDIIDKGPDYFIPTIQTLPSNLWDLAFTKASNDHTYIRFSYLPLGTELLTKNWKYTIPKKYEYSSDYLGSHKIVNKIMATTRSNLELFEIGREIVRDDIERVLVSEENGRKKYLFLFSKGTLAGNPVPNNLAKNLKYDAKNGVLEYVEFVTKKEVTLTTGDTLLKFTVYLINPEAIKMVMDLETYSEKLRTHSWGIHTLELEEEYLYKKFVSKLLKHIYLSDDFRGIHSNTSLKRNTAKNLKSWLPMLANELSYDEDLSKLISYTADLFKDADKEVKASETNKDTFILNRLKYTQTCTKPYYANVAKKVFASFMKALDFTASRIPALTHLSFMRMRCVGYSGDSKNLCFVSHWLTW